MVKLIITIFMRFVLVLFQLITQPINSLITTYFPDITDYLDTITLYLRGNVFPMIAWFLELLPQPVVVALFVYLNAYLIVQWYFEPLYKALIEGITLIKKLPFM